MASNTSTNETLSEDDASMVDTVIATVYGVICIAGLIGHGLVLLVIVRDRSQKSRAVSNSYIASLSVADAGFLFGLPFIIATLTARRWLFGTSLCKVYFTVTSASTFAGAFTLTAMSADRCVAVCCPVSSRTGCRTPVVARLVIFAVWTLAFIAVLPVAIYAQLVPSNRGVSCLMNIPASDGGTSTPTRVYIIYTLVVSFIIPVILISIFYAILVIELQRRKMPGHQHRHPGGGVRNNQWRAEAIPAAGNGLGVRKMRTKKTTWLVTTVVVVYVVCWLPHWSFQLFTILSYANSAVNPLLYVFVNENFRHKCLSAVTSCRTRAPSSVPRATLPVAAANAGCSQAVSDYPLQSATGNSIPLKVLHPPSYDIVVDARQTRVEASCVPVMQTLTTS